MAWDFWEAFNTVVRISVTNPFFIVFIVVILLMIPFSLIGITTVSGWLTSWKRQREGWIKIRKKLSNGRWVEFWSKPTGRKVKIKGEEGYEFELPIRIEKNYMGFQSDLKGDFKLAKQPTPEELRELVKGKKEDKIIIKKGEIDPNYLLYGG